MRVLLAVLALAAFLGGCSSPSLELGPEWAPLLRVEQDPTRLQAVSVVTTIETTLYVSSLAAWEADYPAGSLARTALLTHEREHARRQLAVGVLWFFRYLTEAAFRWDEERVGWRLEILMHEAAGDHWDPPKVAAFLASNYMGMVDEQTAEAWVRSVQTGGE